MGDLLGESGGDEIGVVVAEDLVHEGGEGSKDSLGWIFGFSVVTVPLASLRNFRRLRKVFSGSGSKSNGSEQSEFLRISKTKKKE